MGQIRAYDAGSATNPGRLCDDDRVWDVGILELLVIFVVVVAAALAAATWFVRWRLRLIRTEKTIARLEAEEAAERGEQAPVADAEE